MSILLTYDLSCRALRQGLRIHVGGVYLSLYIISLVCPVVVVLSIHPSRHPSRLHPSKFLIPEEEDDGRGGGGKTPVVLQDKSFKKKLRHEPGLKKPGDFTVFEGHGYPLVFYNTLRSKVTCTIRSKIGDVQAPRLYIKYLHKMSLKLVPKYPNLSGLEAIQK